MSLKHAFSVAALIGAVSLVTTPASSETPGGPLTLAKVAGVSSGPYLRFEVGAAHRTLSDAYWLPPGYPSDPRINFDLGSANGGLAGFAVGYDWMNGWRADAELLYRSSMSLSGVSTISGHADITGGRVRTTALMANVYYAPLEGKGANSTIQPFVTAGLGLADNNIGAWTRTNPSSNNPVRTFSGSAEMSLAAAVGFGVSMQVNGFAGRPVSLEAAYKYYYFGKATGGATPIAGGGNSEPVQPLTFTPHDQVISFSVRIPFKRL